MNIIFWASLKDWYTTYKRELPWRNTQDAYVIWLSEIILQQTRVNQGLPYFEKFLAHFPTVTDFANADESQVLRLWQGLGYYSRARNMHSTAKSVVANNNGVFPSSYNELIKLKGIGAYTAAAIASFSKNEAVAVVDGNVTRVLSRIFNIHEDVLQAKTQKKILQLATEIMPTNEAGTFNQSMMELGAMICKPQNPLCSQCPVNTFCEAKKLNIQNSLPIKIKKLKRKTRYFTYLVFVNDQKIWMKERKGKDIWSNLWDFFLFENKTDFHSIDEIAQSLSKSEIEIFSINSLQKTKHILTHQDLMIEFLEINVRKMNKNFTKENNLVHLSFQEVEALPKPIVISNFVNNSLKKNN